jgi:hypothetical protein
MTDPDEIRAKRGEIEEGGPCRQGDDADKGNSLRGYSPCDEEEMLCSLENYIAQFAHAKD